MIDPNARQREDEPNAGKEPSRICEIIDLRVFEMSHLFTAMDHSPPREKDLDPKVEEFIVSSARAAPHNSRFVLQVYVDRSGVSDQIDTVQDAMVGKARADVLVVGARGVTGLRQLLLGSVAEGALNACPVPVLIVR